MYPGLLWDVSVCGLGACCLRSLHTHHDLEPAGACLGFSVTASELGPRTLSLSCLPLRITHGDGYKRLNKQHFEKQWLMFTVFEGSVGSPASPELSREEDPGLNPTKAS